MRRLSASRKGRHTWVTSRRGISSSIVWTSKAPLLRTHPARLVVRRSRASTSRSTASVLCERCKMDLELAATQGTRAGRFLRAAVYGVGAGAVGSGIWYAVRAATGYEVGLIAVAVGFMVGAAVRKGSNGRGGWRYQALAMFLTYASIVSTYVPDIMTEIIKMGDRRGPTVRPPWAAALPRPRHHARPDPAGGDGRRCRRRRQIRWASRCSAWASGCSSSLPLPSPLRSWAASRTSWAS